jgi:hypothetical protein
MGRGEASPALWGRRRRPREERRGDEHGLHGTAEREEKKGRNRKGLSSGARLRRVCVRQPTLPASPVQQRVLTSHATIARLPRTGATGSHSGRSVWWCCGSAARGRRLVGSGSALGLSVQLGLRSSSLQWADVCRWASGPSHQHYKQVVVCTPTNFLPGTNQLIVRE